MIASVKPRLRAARQSVVEIAPKRADAELLTPEHRAWRAIVIARAGGMCQWPGCGRVERRMFADHIVERKDGGARYDPDNGQCLCGSHHSLKTAQERARRLNEDVEASSPGEPSGGGGSKV
ncbi:MAG: HNH endonuclease signature motif containing protein [Rhodoblastus sp.]